MKTFTELDRFILESIRKVLLSRGYKLTYSEINDHIKKTFDLNARFNQTQHSLNYLWSMYNPDPPKPPYNYYFETHDEAISFAQKAKKKYDVNCNIDLVNFRRWKLSSKKKKKLLAN